MPNRLDDLGSKSRDLATEKEELRVRLSQPRSNTLATRGTITAPLLSAGDWKYSSTGSVGSAK
ncbi:MAG: hypothetical protein ACPIOQ_68165, partial [Promethearchaeia archaeon]